MESQVASRQRVIPGDAVCIRLVRDIAEGCAPLDVQFGLLSQLTIQRKDAAGKTLAVML